MRMITCFSSSEKEMESRAASGCSDGSTRKPSLAAEPVELIALPAAQQHIVGDKGQIELSVLEEVEDLIKVGDLDIGQDIGIAQPEPGKDGGEHHHFRMGGTADAQQFKIPFLGDLPGDGVQFGENIPGHRIEGFSGGG